MVLVVMKKILAYGDGFGDLVTEDDEILEDSNGDTLFFMDGLRLLAVASQMDILVDDQAEPIIDSNDDEFLVLGDCKLLTYDTEQ